MLTNGPLVAGFPRLSITNQEQIPINQLKSNTKHVTLTAHDVISPHFAIFKKYEPQDIDYVIRDALMKTDKILKFSSELQIIRFVQSALVRFCNIYPSTGDNAASLSFEFAGDKSNPEIVIERSFMFSEKNERDIDAIRVTKKWNTKISKMFSKSIDDIVVNGKVVFCREKSNGMNAVHI